MKQIALGLTMYTQDYDSKLPRYDNYFEGNQNYSAVFQAMPYIKSRQIFRCPSAPAIDPFFMDAPWTVSLTYGFPYAFQGNSSKAANTFGPIKTVGLDSFDKPSELCLLGETRNPYSNYEDYGYGADYFPGFAVALFDDPGYGAKYLNSVRHLEGSNYAFMDGHVKWFSKAKVLSPPSQRGIKFREGCYAGTSPAQDDVCE